MSPEQYDDETKELDAPGPLGPWAHKNVKRSFNFEGKKANQLLKSVRASFSVKVSRLFH